jgi:hypothetical protein
LANPIASTSSRPAVADPTTMIAIRIVVATSANRDFCR